MRTLVYPLLAVGMLALPAAAGWKSLDGQPVPPIAAKAWLNVPRKTTPTAADLRGKVWLLEFFATW